MREENPAPQPAPNPLDEHIAQVEKELIGHLQNTREIENRLRDYEILLKQKEVAQVNLTRAESILFGLRIAKQTAEQVAEKEAEGKSSPSGESKPVSQSEADKRFAARRNGHVEAAPDDQSPEPLTEVEAGKSTGASK